MRIGDLVRNLNSESGLLGIIVGWQRPFDGSDPQPIVHWTDGRTNWILAHRIKVIA